MVEWVGWGFLWNWQRMETTDNDGYLPSVICECVLCGERDPIDPQVLVFGHFCLFVTGAGGSGRRWGFEPWIQLHILSCFRVFLKLHPIFLYSIWHFLCSYNYNSRQEAPTFVLTGQIQVTEAVISEMPESVLLEKSSRLCWELCGLLFYLMVLLFISNMTVAYSSF